MSNLSKNRADSEHIKYAAITAMFAALITVTTAYIKIPAPLGYAHAGDSMIYLAASVLPGPLGFAAAAIGGGLADLLDSNYKGSECSPFLSDKACFEEQSEAR